MELTKQNINITDAPPTAVHKKKKGDMLARMRVREAIVIYGIITLFLIACVIPFLMLISGSFTSSDEVQYNGVSIFPKVFSVASYEAVLAYPEAMLRSYMVSILVTIGGTVLNMALLLPLSYALSRKGFSYRGQISFFFVFTVMFSGGYVPSYILYRNYLHIFDTIWVLILPHGVTVGYMIFLRTFFAALPHDLFESAEIDGANEWQCMLKIALPLIVPGIATVVFYIVLMYWNDSQSALLFTDNENLVPVALYVTRMQQYINFLMFSEQYGIGTDAEIPSATLVFATAVITTLPMLFLFSAFQKYFVRGLTAGGVKG